MRRFALLAFITLAAVTPVNAAPVARVAQYRTAKAADAYITSPSLGDYQFVFLQPSSASTTGYVTGAGMVATPDQPGLIDATKPWVIVTHTNPDGTLGCFSATNLAQQSPSDALQPGSYILIDQTTTTHEALVALSVTCADGTDQLLKAVWYAPPWANPPGEFAWTFPFSGAQGDPSGNVALHGINYDAYFTVCGDVSGCLPLVAQSYWRVYDANLTIAR